MPSTVICGKALVGLVGDTVDDVRVFERQDADWFVTNHRPRPHLEPPHVLSEPTQRLVTRETWPGAHLLGGAQEAGVWARRGLRYSAEPSSEAHQLEAWQQPPKALGSSPPVWAQDEHVEPAFQQHWQQHWQQHLRRALG